MRAALSLAGGFRWLSLEGYFREDRAVFGRSNFYSARTLMLTRRSLLRMFPAVYGLSRFKAIAALIPASGRVFHVSVRGDDRNDGSASHRMRTISAAAAKAQPGDVVRVYAGTY